VCSTVSALDPGRAGFLQIREMAWMDRLSHARGTISANRPAGADTAGTHRHGASHKADHRAECRDRGDRGELQRPHSPYLGLKYPDSTSEGPRFCGGWFVAHQGPGVTALILRRAGIGALVVSISAGMMSNLLFLAAFQFRLDSFLEPTLILGSGAISAELLR
jgi:hypothetical protein